MQSLHLPPPVDPPAEVFHLGSTHSPAGSEIGVDAVSLRLDGARWMPVMGELHYARVPASDWREELLKMKAGGITVVSTYVFWIHHEETRDAAFDWSGDRDLRRFIATAGELGLRVVVRVGPWCHGEVRNGGLPDWIVSDFGDKARTDDPAYLARVRRFFSAISAQIDGLLWKQGGPIVAIQIENEYFGPAEHLITLKRLARELGLDAPLYTRTGWFDPSTPVPFGELLPLYGAYPEGFWDREITPMPNAYPANFRFSSQRTDVGIACDLKGGREAIDPPDTHRYPFLTCEIGGGMMSAYHRRIRIDPRDIEAVVLTKLGSGGNLPGYYMYHGGVNPEGRTSLQESQATGYWNDMPEKNYDFQAPLGAAGQLRPHYHRLRRLNLFVGDYGALLAGMPASFPVERPGSRDDIATLRWSVRSDGRSGFVFVNNHERLRALPPKEGVRFPLVLADGVRLEFPSAPVTVPSGASFIWPFGLDLAPGVRLDHASAQLLCHLDDGPVRTVFFAATPGIPSEFAFNGGRPETLAPGRRVARIVAGKGGAELRVVLLDDADSLALWKGGRPGRERVFLSRAGLVFDGGAPRASSESATDLSVSVFSLSAIGAAFASLPLRAETPAMSPAELVPEPLRTAGAPRKIAFGKTTPPVAVAPVANDFAAAAAWRLRLPAGFDAARMPILRLGCEGDVARVLLGGRVVMDDFFNGDTFDVDLTRHAAALAAGEELVVEILPLTADAPILLPEGCRPPAGSPPVARLQSATLVPLHRASLP